MNIVIWFSFLSNATKLMLLLDDMLKIIRIGITQIGTSEEQKFEQEP